MTPGASPRVVFRADASLDIGTGHVMRCLTLADALRERGARCEFICRALPGHRIDEIRRRGFAVSVLHDADTGSHEARPPDAAAGYGRWLGVPVVTDAHQSLAALEHSVDWLVVDHYALDRDWEQAVRPAADRIMVIDDLADRPHDCELLLDQNLGSVATDYVGLVPEDCEVLCGPRFALLRPEFARQRAVSLENRAGRRLSRVLVSMGGVDQDNATGQVLDALGTGAFPRGADKPALGAGNPPPDAGNPSPDVTVTVIMGQAAPWLHQVRAQAEALPFPVEIAVEVADMAARMAASDFAIGAAGSTSWERCCMGLPSALVVLADNQAKLCRELAQAGAAVALGSVGDVARTLPPVLDMIRREPRRLAEMSAAAARICDGQGASRIADHLLGHRQPGTRRND